MIKDAVARNNEAGVPTGLFSNVQGNPTGKNVEDGIAAYKAGGHDGVIAFGGGSALDAAKAVALMIGQKRPIWDYEDIGDWWTRVDPNGIATIIAVPTTSGTGSEVGRASVITDQDNHVKKIIFHPKMLPSIVIDDPELTVGLPAHITAATGMDALSHCLEGLLRAGLPPAGRRHRARRHAPDQGRAAGGGEGRQEPGRALQHDGGGQHGRHRVPEGPRRHARHQPPAGRALQHASRPDQRGRDALCAGIQPQRHRRAADAPRRATSTCPTRRSSRCWTGSSPCARRSASRTR
jgi:hypothetical protein